MPKDPLPAGVLDRDEARPLYYQLKQWISEQIASGRFPPGSRLPDEQQLSSSLKVSRGVVRQAMSELAFEGRVSKQQGRGTFVAEPKVEARLMSQLPGLAADAAAHGQSVSSQVLGLEEVPAGEEVARSLGLTPGTPVVRLERLRSIGGEPLVLAVTYLPSALAGGLLEVDLEGEVSLYEVLQRDFDLPVVAARRQVEAAIAGAREARLLTVQPFDASTMKLLEKAISDSGIGLNPSNDGKIIRLSVPELNEDRRRELVKVARGIAEEGRIKIRNIRRDTMKDLKELKDEGDVGEDEEKRAEAEVQKVTDQRVGELDAALKVKEAEILEV